MKQQIEDRLAALKTEFEAGQRKLEGLENEAQQLRRALRPGRRGDEELGACRRLEAVQLERVRCQQYDAACVRRRAVVSAKCTASLLAAPFQKKELAAGAPQPGRGDSWLAMACSECQMEARRSVSFVSSFATLPKSRWKIRPPLLLTMNSRKSRAPAAAMREQARCQTKNRRRYTVVIYRSW
jgi:hypothetical protein